MNLAQKLSHIFTLFYCSMHNPKSIIKIKKNHRCDPKVDRSAILLRATVSNRFPNGRIVRHTPPQQTRHQPHTHDIFVWKLR